MAKKDTKKAALRAVTERQRMSAANAADARANAQARKSLPKTAAKPAGRTTVPSEIKELRSMRANVDSAKLASKGRMARLGAGVERMGQRAAADASARAVGRQAVRALAGRAIKGAGALSLGIGVASVAYDAYTAGKKLQGAMVQKPAAAKPKAATSVNIRPSQAKDFKRKEAPKATAKSGFGSAFAAARKKLGKGSVFEYKGKKYNTRYKGE